MGWHIIKIGQDHGNNSNYMEFLIDSASDIGSPPTEYSYAPSSIAHTPGFANIYEADANGEWVEVGGGS